ncbi:hypothetical protein Tco_1476928 [Tanacetum coccineum]
MRLKNSFNAVGENDQEDEQQEQVEEEVMNTKNDEQTSRPKNKLNDAPVFVDVVKLKGKKVVEKLVSSKKSKQVAVESELIPVDNDVHVSADEKEAETKVAGGNKRKKDVNEDNKVDGKLVSFKKVKQVVDGSELVLVDNEKKDVKLGMWVVKSYDLETHTLRMGDGRRIKVSRKLIHEILGVPMGENKVISLPSTTSEDITTTNWRYTTPFIEDKIHITRVDDHVSSLTANGWPFQVGFFCCVLFCSSSREQRWDSQPKIYTHPS